MQNKQTLQTVAIEYSVSHFDKELTNDALYKYILIIILYFTMTVHRVCEVYLNQQNNTFLFSISYA